MIRPSEDSPPGPGGRRKLTSPIAALVGVPAALLLAWLGHAAWSIHHAESQAQTACNLYRKNMTVDAYFAGLKGAGFAPVRFTDPHTGEQFIDTTFKTVAISRYVCVVRVQQDRVASAEVRFVD